MSSPDASRENVETPISVGQAAWMPGELIYEYTPRVTRVVEYVASADDVSSGQVHVKAYAV